MSRQSIVSLHLAPSVVYTSYNPSYHLETYSKPS